MLQLELHSECYFQFICIKDLFTLFVAFRFILDILSALTMNSNCPTAAEIPVAFRGRVVSFRRTGRASAGFATGRRVLACLGLTPCGISPISYFPLESTGISSAGF